MPRRPVLAVTAAALAAAALALTAATLATPPQETLLHGADYVGTYVWSRDESDFGGFSGLELSADGAEFYAVTDSAVLYRGRLHRDAAGAVTGVETDGPRRLSGPGGRALRQGESDAEGLALAEDGTLYISFEGLDRVSALPPGDGPLITFPRPDPFMRMRTNLGLEALALDPQGRPITLPEESGAPDWPFPVWRLTGRTWDRPFALPRDGAFVPTGADFGPDGALYLIERDFRYLLGFRTRVSRFQIGPQGPGPRQVLLETQGPVHDNLEAIAVWRDSGGAIRLTLMSDDNFSPFQRTEIVDYRLP